MWLRSWRAHSIALAIVTLLPFSVGAAAPARAQALTGKLLFVATSPCRLLDTRPANGGDGILTSGATYSFDVVGATRDLSGQGGSAGGCGIPGYAAGKPQASAVAVNLTAIDPSGKGNLRAWPGDGAEPLASVINFNVFGAAGTNLANMIILPLAADAVEGADLTVKASFANVHLVADAVGYFTRATRRYCLRKGPVDGDVAAVSCPVGYHMASLFEVLDPGALEYSQDTACERGVPDADLGAGPPTGKRGFIRTGAPASLGDTTPGKVNCGGWTAAGAYGTAVRLPDDWTTAASAVSPWVAERVTCDDGLTGVWCVED
jgi:hypothetical protein